MIPILYDSTETAFASNGLGRLRDIISCVCREERNGVYEVDFEYPIDGVNYDRIQLGRIIAVEHDESGDVQPFDIVSYSRPINGVVTFHAVHISYRQTALTCTGSNINSLADAFTLFGTALPDNPFNYWTDKNSVGFMASADGVPHSVRTMLGGMEGSVIDAYGGEYEWDNWTVKLWSERGSLRNFSIRYGINLVNYEEELDYSDTYTAVLPYWKGQDASGNDITVVGDMVQSGYPSFNGSERCIPLDVTDKFDTEDGQPTKAQIEAEGLNYINANQPYLPAQTLKVDFARITDSPEYAQFANLQKCRLCDSITVIFPRYKTEGVFKIVKTEYDVLQERYLTLELGTLAVTLSEALGINQEAANRVRYGGGGGGGGADGCVLKAESISVPVGGSDTVFNPTSNYTKGETFTAGSNNRIIVNEACRCIVTTAMVFSAISATNAIKVVGLGKNSSASEICMAAVGYPTAWTSVAAVDVVDFQENDVLHFTGRCSSGTNTLRQANIAIIRID